MNMHRRKLTRVLPDLAATVTVVEHRDRLTYFEFDHVTASRRLIVVLNQSETTRVLPSLHARLYDPRSVSQRAVKAVAVARGEQETSP